jgi:hypothetical protein
VEVTEAATTEVADVFAIIFETLEVIDGLMTLLRQNCGRILRK